MEQAGGLMVLYIYYYYLMFTILCCQMIRLIIRWNKCILWHSWSNKYLECSLFEKIRKKKKKTLKIGKNLQANVDAGQRALAVRVDEEVHVFTFS